VGFMPFPNLVPKLGGFEGASRFFFLSLIFFMSSVMSIMSSSSLLVVLVFKLVDVPCDRPFELGSLDFCVPLRQALERSPIVVNGGGGIAVLVMLSIDDVGVINVGTPVGYVPRRLCNFCTV
jgi:hypothetical protein